MNAHTKHIVAFTKGEIDPLSINALPERMMVKAFGDMFTNGMDFLREFSSDNVVKDIAQRGYDVIHHGYATTVLNPLVQTIHTMIAGNSLRKAPGDRKRKIQIYVPVHWPTLVYQNPTYQLSALISTASRIVDGYQGNILSLDRMTMRSRAYEAQFILAIKAEFPGYPLDIYMQEILQDFPQGIRSESFGPLRYPMVQVQPR